MVLEKKLEFKQLVFIIAQNKDLSTILVLVLGRKLKNKNPFVLVRERKIRGITQKAIT